MFSCCATAYITQKPAVCFVSMSLPVQQFVLHIPRLHYIFRGDDAHWPKSLEIPLVHSLRLSF